MKPCPICGNTMCPEMQGERIAEGVRFYQLAQRVAAIIGPRYRDIPFPEFVKLVDSALEKSNIEQTGEVNVRSENSRS